MLPNGVKRSFVLGFGLLASGAVLLPATDAFPASAAAASPPACPSLQWWRGQTHAHANWGPPHLPWTSPDVVVRWYREHAYNFISVTDLNYYTPPEGLK